MDWVELAIGFVLGFLTTYIAMRIERRWQAEDDKKFAEEVLENLVFEVQEGIGRAEYMASLVAAGGASFGRIYTVLWESTRERLAATLSTGEALKLLHRIYYRFDLINFNAEVGRPGPAGAFAKEYIDEMKQNLEKLRALTKKG